MRQRAGVTLIELVVVLTVLSILAGVVALSMHAMPRVTPSGDASARVLVARATALRFGHPVTVILPLDGVDRAATAFPDGRVEAEPALHFELLSGRASNAAH